MVFFLLFVVTALALLNAALFVSWPHIARAVVSNEGFGDHSADTVKKAAGRLLVVNAVSFAALVGSLGLFAEHIW